MALPEIVGHEDLREAIGRAAAQETLAQSLLFHGPAGAGKERLGLWVAQLLVCEQGMASPCGKCRACRMTLRLEHPDVHWFFPLPRPDAASADRLRDKLEELRATELQSWRDNPLRIPSFDRAPAHFVASMRTILQLASVRPSVGSRKVFVIGDAELMVPQESSPEAANALLKLLEEPPADTTIILTSSQPGALLPTIRSRVLALPVPPLRNEELAQLLVDANIAEPAPAAKLAERARGSVSAAIRLAGLGDAPDPQRQAGRDLLVAALSMDSVLRFAEAIRRKPSGARLDLIGELDSFAEWLRDLAAVASGAAERVSDPSAVPILERAVKQRSVTAEGALAAIEHVTTARDLALGNVNPQLIVADLLRLVRGELLGKAAGDGDYAHAV